MVILIAAGIAAGLEKYNLKINFKNMFISMQIPHIGRTRSS